MGVVPKHFFDLPLLSPITLITFLTIENKNMKNYIVTFEYRVMVTAFAILAMFYKYKRLHHTAAVLD